MTEDRHEERRRPASDDAADATEGDGESQSHGRTVAEWTTLGISLAIVLGVAGLVTYLYLAGVDRPPVIEATAGLIELRQEGDAYYLPVTIENTGEQTAADVRVEAELVLPDGSSETAEIEVTFLAGGATSEGTAVFSSDPAEGEVTVRAVSYKVP